MTGAKQPCALGFASNGSSSTVVLWTELHHLMVQQPTDYHMLYRQLADVLDASAGGMDGAEDVSLVAPLGSAFHEPLSTALAARWAAWVRRWLAELRAEGREAAAAASAMRRVNPKFVPREWMLVEACESAGASNLPVSAVRLPCAAADTAL